MMVNYPNPRHGSRVIPIGRDSYFTQGTQVETLYQNQKDFDRASALEQTRTKKSCQTPKDFDRASALEQQGGLLTGREALWPLEPRHSLDKATPSYYTRNGSFASGISKMSCVCVSSFTGGGGGYLYGHGGAPPTWPRW
jgi:hypothetical protein